MQPRQAERQGDAHHQPGERLRGIRHHFARGALHRGIRQIQRERELPPGQNAEEHPGGAHGHVAPLLEHQQNDAIDEVDDGGCSHIRGIRFGGDDLLNLPTELVEDVALHRHQRQRAEHQPAPWQIPRQVDEDVGEVLDQPLAPQKRRGAPLQEHPVVRDSLPLGAVEVLAGALEHQPKHDDGHHERHHVPGGGFGEHGVQIARLAPRDGEHGEHEERSANRHPQPREDEQRQRRNRMQPGDPTLRHRKLGEPPVGHIPAVHHPPVAQHRHQHPTGKQPQQPPRPVRVGG